MFEKVKDLIVSELNVDPAKVTLEANLTDDLGADSVDAVELIMAVEEQFNIQISDEVAQSIKTVGDIVKFAEELTK